MEEVVEHVHLEFEEKYWVDDGLQEEHIDEFIIWLGDSMTNHPVRAVTMNPAVTSPSWRCRVIVIMSLLFILCTLL